MWLDWPNSPLCASRMPMFSMFSPFRRLTRLGGKFAHRAFGPRSTTPNIQLQRISSVRAPVARSPTTEATKALVCAIVPSLTSLLRLSSFWLFPVLNQQKKGQNCAARIVFKARKWGHVLSLVQFPHWLPICSRISYKLKSFKLCHTFY